MRYDILANYDSLMYKDKTSNSFITDSESDDLIKIAYSIDSLVKYKDKVSLVNIKIITDIPIDDLKNFIDFILACEEAAIRKYK